MFYRNSKFFVDHEKLWVALKQTVIPRHLIALMHNLYCGQEALSGQDMERQDDFLQAKVSDRGAFNLPTCLICMQNMYKKKSGLDSEEGGVEISGENINKICR